MNYKIALIRGDGIGPEVVGEAVKVMEAIGEKFGHTFTPEARTTVSFAGSWSGSTPTLAAP